ncbi:ATPase, AAA-type, core [Dillenia turbinata]|uniref:ATPase, AAA-type, core n=1 Tax=Dillenia turbinata TaxID=194707 RepID=A0AAN8UW61_9MAGN
MLDSKMLSEINMPSAKIVVSTAASLAASAMVIRSVARELVPDDLKYYFTLTIKKILKSFSNQLTLVIEDHDGLSSNQMYEAASIYLGAKISPSTRRLIVRMPVKEKKIYFSVASNQELIDVFDGVKFKWRQVTRHVEYQPYPGHPGRPSPSKMEIRYLEPQVTLSGLLNFTDGLWSSCGDERIIIFTTNNKHKLDPALLRPGRMDMHIHMSYCTPRGFEILANNYLRITNHSLFQEIEDLIERINVTPAELAEQLLKHDDADIVLGGVTRFLEAKAREIEEMNVKKRTREMMDAPEKIEEF